MKSTSGIVLLSCLVGGPVLAQQPNGRPHHHPGGAHQPGQPRYQAQPRFQQPPRPQQFQPRVRVVPQVPIPPRQSVAPPRYQYQQRPPIAAPQYRYQQRRWDSTPGYRGREWRGGPYYRYQGRGFYDGRRFARPRVDVYRYRRAYSYLPRFHWLGTWGLAAPLVPYTELSFLQNALLIGQYFEDGRIVYVYLVDEDGLHREFRVDEFGNVLSETIVP